MSARNPNQIANLNSVDDESKNGEKYDDAELQMFSNTTFFDLDIGRSTDIATTVDELLMQQEKQIQYPVKQQPLDDIGPVPGPSYSNSNQMGLRPGQASSGMGSGGFPLGGQQNRLSQNSGPFGPGQFSPDQRQLPFDFSTLQGFSLAGELPQASLSFYDVDPMFHEQDLGLHDTNPLNHHSQNQAPSHHHDTQHLGVPHHSHASQFANMPHHVNGQRVRDEDDDLLKRNVRQRPVQRHELADQYDSNINMQAPQKSGAARDSESQGVPTGVAVGSDGATESSANGLIPTDDEKRRRNTLASARFRIKKKQREQEMEKNQKLMQKRLADQEERIKQLEMENNWLKSLVVEKNTARDSNSLGKLRKELLNNN